MKCLCGYEKARAYETENNEEIGDEDFIDIHGNFTITGGDYYRSLREVSLYACPKCGTIQMQK